MIKPEKGKYRIQTYCSKTFYNYIKAECRKRDNISMSAFTKNAIYEYLNPQNRVIQQEMREEGIVSVRRTDRTPKKITTLEKMNFGLLNAEFKRTDVKSLLKPVPEEELHQVYNIYVCDQKHNI